MGWVSRGERLFDLSDASPQNAGQDSKAISPGPTPLARPPLNGSPPRPDLDPILLGSHKQGGNTWGLNLIRGAWPPLLTIGLFCPFSPISASGTKRKRRKKAFFPGCPRICLNPHLENPFFLGVQTLTRPSSKGVLKRDF